VSVENRRTARHAKSDPEVLAPGPEWFVRN